LRASGFVRSGLRPDQNSLTAEEAKNADVEKENLIDFCDCPILRHVVRKNRH
jgi:hypothetical protein